MWHFRDIFVSSTYLAVICEEAVAVGCILVGMSKYVGHIF